MTWSAVVTGAGLVAVLAAALGVLAALLRRVSGASSPSRLLRSGWPALAVVAVAAGLVLRQAGPPPPAWAADGGRGAATSGWDSVQEARPDGVTEARDRVRPGLDTAWRTSVQPGDSLFGQTDTERAEVVLRAERTAAREGEEQWYGWSFLLERLPVVEGDGAFFSTTQWHQESETCPPNVALLVSGGDAPRLLLAVRGGDLDEGSCEPAHRETVDAGPLEAGTWSDVVVRARWSAGRGALLELWRDGVRVARSSTPNLYTGQSAYLKQGVYRSTSTEPAVLYLAGTARGGEAAVLLPGCAPLEGRRLSLSRLWCGR
jgi:hypothetical protein